MSNDLKAVTPARQHCPTEEERALGEMRHPFFARLFAGRPEDYPYALEAQFERILKKIAALWSTPEMSAYFEELMIDKRGGRQGFPDDVARDIFRLNVTYESQRNRGEVDDPWGLEPEEHAVDMKVRVQHFAHALESNDVRRIAELLDAGVPVDTPVRDGWTPLMVATFNASEASAILLIERGANVTVSDVDGYTPLHWVALNGFDRVAAMLFDRRADINAVTRYGITPLMQAAGRGHVGVTRRLLERGARPNLQDHEGWSALHKAISNGHLEVSLLLLSKGANPHVAHKSGLTPVDIAFHSKRPSIQRLFRSAPPT